MYGETISHKRHWAWVAVAMSAPIAHFSGGSWLTLLVLGAVCYGLVVLLPNEWEGIMTSRLMCAVELGWIVLLLSQLMPLSAAYWPGPKSETIIPAVLLALGAYCCNRRASRVAGVLFWVLIIMYAPVLAAGVKDVQFDWLIPDSMGISLWMIPVLLLPCAAKFLPGKSEGRSWYPGILLAGVGVWMITSGVLSASVAHELDVPFRELSRSLTIGAASRFEALIGVIVTLGWFGFGSLLIRCGSLFGERLGIHETLAPWLVAGASAGLQWFRVRISSESAAIYSVAAWILLPFIFEKIFRKISKKPLDK